jgi:hypothetical protein
LGDAAFSRLNALSGGGDKADSIIDNSKGELPEQRNIKIHNTTNQEGKADFFLLLTKGSGLGGSVDGVKFIS